MNFEKINRETTLAKVMPELLKGKIAKVVKKYETKFTPKYRSFSIIQNKIEDVVKKSTQIWKLSMG